MKGHTKIILTNVETGEQEVHEDNNLVTNALDKIINIEAAMNRAPMNEALPIATNALGGIMLFDGELTESVDNIHFPVEAHLVGYADTSVNTDDVNRGSYNAVESGPTEDGYVNVWDFGTSQCNGTIKSVARTHKWGGQNPLRYFRSQIMDDQSDGNPTTDLYWYPIRYDGEYLYIMKGDESTHIMRLARVKIPMLKFGVGDYHDAPRTYEIIASWNTLVTTYEYVYRGQTYTDSVYADAPYSYEDGQDGYLYCMAYGNYRDGNTYGYDVTYFTIKYDDNSFTKSQTAYLATGMPYYSDQTGWYMHWANRYMGHVHNGVLYRISSGRKHISVIPLDNVSSASTIRIISDNSNDYIENVVRIAPHNGGIYMLVYHYTDTGYIWRNGIVYPDGEFKLIEVAGTSDQYNWGYMMTNDDDLTVWNCYTYYSRHAQTSHRDFACNYLGTINNLQTSITKTSAQTMKIVYTLTDVDEDTGD